MSIERVFRCDAEDCRGSESSIYTEPQGSGWMVVRETGHVPRELHFCTWDCVLKYAAAQPPVERIPLGDA